MHTEAMVNRAPPSPDARDQRLLELIEARKIAPPDNELLADIYRRRGDLAAAAAEYGRLHGQKPGAHRIDLLHAIFNRGNAPPRLPQSEFAPAPFVQFDGFFEPSLNKHLLDYAISRQGIFRPTELQSADQYEKQRSTLVTYDVGAPGETMRAAVRERLPLLCERLGMPVFDIDFIQLKIAAYADGDFFKAHQDNGLSQPGRRISFVYYFHQEPKPYRGGDLLLYDSRFSPRAYVRSLFTRIVPQNDSIVFFPSEYFHEVLPVQIATQDFSSSRFTMAGHIG